MIFDGDARVNSRIADRQVWSVRTLRWIDPQTRSADLDVLVCIAADKTPLLCQWSSTTTHSAIPSSSRPQVQEGCHLGTVCDSRQGPCDTRRGIRLPSGARAPSFFGATSAQMEDLDGRVARCRWRGGSGGMILMQQSVQNPPDKIVRGRKAL